MSNSRPCISRLSLFCRSKATDVLLREVDLVRASQASNERPAATGSSVLHASERRLLRMIGPGVFRVLAVRDDLDVPKRIWTDITVARHHEPVFSDSTLIQFSRRLPDRKPLLERQMPLDPASGRCVLLHTKCVGE